MTKKRITLIGTLLALVMTGVIAVVSIAPAAQSGSVTTSSSTTSAVPSPNLQLQYDDSWVKNIPSTIDGFEVLFVATPKNRACIVQPSVTVKAMQQSLEEYLAKVDPKSVLETVRSIKGVPANVQVVFSGGPDVSSDSIQSYVAKWNKSVSAVGCPGRWTDTEIGNSGSGSTARG